LKIGVAARTITPFGANPDWDGSILSSGLWGEQFTDSNHNGRWDVGEPFVDDPANDAIDPSSRGKWDGIYLAGFGSNRPATGRHDDLWARALVLEQDDVRIAIVAIDVIGYYSKANYYGLGEIRKQIDPKLRISEILIASTHNHEAPDTIGPWGSGPLSDGKYPKYLRFIDQQIAKAITAAAASMAPAVLKLGHTDPRLSPSIAGMQTRTHGRPPNFFDEELRVMQFFSGTTSSPGRVIATLINWNTHPESMEDKNTLISSDFPGTVRDEIERKYGGVAVYVSGDIGAVEIIGDSNNKVSDRTRFDGKEFSLNPENRRPAYTFERTEAIGLDVARAVVQALGRGEWSSSSRLIVDKAPLRATMDNAGYTFLAARGVLDTMPPPKPGETTQIESTVYALKIGDAEVITTPGELFPEVFYGVAKNRRSDCSEADTGRPPEPSVRDLMKGKYRFVFGLCPDEFGYIVPGYDFRAPAADLSAGPRQAQDPCKSKGVPNHYHETNSASSQLAARWACVSMTLLGGEASNTDACRK